MNERKRAPSLLYWGGGLIVAACLGYNVLSYDRVIATAPHVPNAATGNVIPYNNHGTTVYLTRKQELMERWGPFGWLVWRFSQADAK